MRKLLDVFVYIAAFAAAVAVFNLFDLEGLLLKRADFEPVGAREIAQDTTKNYAGLPGGDDVAALTEIGQWDGLIPGLDYVTVTPRAVYETDVYTLAKWEGFFNRRTSRTSGGRRDEVVSGWLHMPQIYCPIYVIELADGSHVLAQMNRCYARQIRAGAEITLPLGTKAGMLDKTRVLLKDAMDTYQTPDDYLLYMLNDAWQKKNTNGIFIGKIAVSVLADIVIGSVLLIAVNALLKKRRTE